MLTEGQLDMVERAARNSFPVDARGEMILAVLLELIEQERKRCGLADFGDRVQGDRVPYGADAGPKWLELLRQIRDEMVRLESALAGMRLQMERLEEAGMYPAVPSESWESRSNSTHGEARYLRLVFPSRAPGPRKVYVGCDPAKITEARKRASNRRAWEWLDREATRLDRFLRMQRAGLERVAREVSRYEVKEWLSAELSTDLGSGLNGLGTVGAGAQPAGVTKEEGDDG
jgi:hypothetical protein